MTTVRAPAKINLVLRVGPVRPDGFHRLATLFQALDLHDELEIEPAAVTTVEGFEGDTLVTRALELLGETARVRLTKRIPVAGGLGGGSSDAAAVLRHYARRRRVDDLYAMARTLGSDVPFFLSGLETALGTGRGDRLQHVTDLPRDYGVVLVPSDRGLSTADVYAACEPNELFDAVRGDLIRGVHTARGAAGVAGAGGQRSAGARPAAPPRARRRARRAAGPGRAGRRRLGQRADGVRHRRGPGRPRSAWLRPSQPRSHPPRCKIRAMSEWNISGDGMTIEQSKRRSPMRWLRDNSLKLAIVIGLSEAAVAYFKGFHFLWAIGLLAVFGYWWIRNRVPQSVRRPLWVVATSQAIAGLVVPAVFAGLFIAVIVGAILLVIMLLVLLGDLRRT